VGPISLYAERRPFMEKVNPGVAGAFPLGMAFAAGWTPCIGPVLGGILLIAGQQSTARGVLLLICYSLGLGVPFLLVGVGVQKLMGTVGWIKRHYRAISVVSGALLVGVGVLLMTGMFTRYLVTPLQRFAPGL
jgi:cytochrome c-type biogenesis protein